MSSICDINLKVAERLRNYEAGSPWQSELDKIQLL